MISISVKQNESGQRLDKLLMKTLKNAPASFVYKMLRKKNITLNGKKASGDEKISVGDSISFFFSDETFNKFSGEDQKKDNSGDSKVKEGHVQKPGNIKKGNAQGFGNINEVYIPSLNKNEIVYEDSDIIIVNKSVGELSQKADKNDISINERIVSYLKNQNIGVNEYFTPGICNRLDRNTSGLIIAGKSLKGLQAASKAIKGHNLKKYYLCIAKGKITGTIKISAWLKKDEKTNKADVKNTEIQGYDEIKAEYSGLVTGKDYTLVAIRLITGKTHQIRAHMAYMGNPLIGDAKYGGRDKAYGYLKHQLLHAFMLKFDKINDLPEISNKTVYCMPPKEFENTAVSLFGREEYINAVMEFKRLKGLES